MRKALLAFILSLALAGSALAGPSQAYGGKPDARPAKTPASAAAHKTAAATPVKGAPAVARHAHRPLNNVIKMDKEGRRTALCCCGAEFAVTDASPTLMRDGTTFYMCSAGCKEASEKETAQQAAAQMAVWNEKYAQVKLASNAVAKDGKETAVCGCGKTFTVTSTSPVIEENGVRMYCCSQACHDSFVKMTADQRLAMEKKVENEPVEASASASKTGG